MLLEALSPLSFVVGAVVSYAASNFFHSRDARSQQEVLKHGLVAEGHVTAITGMLARRVYFEFQPRGKKAKVQCCHVDRRDGSVASLPSVGTRVTVRYLPENPRRAVIAKLVSRFVKH
jgi:hypothetical protein